MKPKTLSTLKMKHCKVCEPKPNKMIPVEDVKNPKCGNCGKGLFGMRIFQSGKNRPLEEMKPKTLSTVKAKESWEVELETILGAWKMIKKLPPLACPTLKLHNFPVWKLGKDWKIKRIKHDYGSFITAKPKDERLEGLILFS